MSSDNENLRSCTKCFKEKSITEFTIKPSQPGTYNKYCNRCLQTVANARKRRRLRAMQANEKRDEKRDEAPAVVAN